MGKDIERRSWACGTLEKHEISEKLVIKAFIIVRMKLIIVIR